MPRVSVIMNCLNCSKYVGEAIDSVYAQTYKDWEIIFWDNASTDNSAEMAKGYDNRLKYFRSGDTVPLGKARNWAIEKASGDYIAFLDCDDIWLPQKLEMQIPLFEKNDKTGLVYCNTFFLNQITGKERLLYKRDNQPRGIVFGALLSNYFLSMETAVIRRRALDSLDEWFDERFNISEEADLFIRLAHDWEADYIFQPLAKWRVHPESWTWTRPDLFAEELKMMLAKYGELYLDFRSEYGTEVRNVEMQIAYYEAVEKWKHGSSADARKMITPYIMDKPKMLVVYLLSVLSYKQYEKILRFFKKHP